MSPVQTNTQQGLITVPAQSDLSASVGCFAKIDTSGYAALPSANGLALYVIEDAYTSYGVYQTVLRPLSPDRNVRVIANAVLTAGANVTTTSAGKAVAASSGGNILGVTEEACVVGQYVKSRPLGGIQTA